MTENGCRRQRQPDVAGVPSVTRRCAWCDAGPCKYVSAREAEPNPLILGPIYDEAGTFTRETFDRLSREATETVGARTGRIEDRPSPLAAHITITTLSSAQMATILRTYRPGNRPGYARSMALWRLIVNAVGIHMSEDERKDFERECLR